jgi:hypothetical protein
MPAPRAMMDEFLAEMDPVDEGRLEHGLTQMVTQPLAMEIITRWRKNGWRSLSIEEQRPVLYTISKM